MRILSDYLPSGHFPSVRSTDLYRMSVKVLYNAIALNYTINQRVKIKRLQNPAMLVILYVFNALKKVNL